MPAATPDQPVVVAGGGIGGLAAALALVRQQLVGWNIDNCLAT